MDTLLNTVVAAPDSLEPSGYAFNVRVIPDLFTGEIFNVGVSVVRPDGVRLVRILHEPGRLSCLYGVDVAENILYLAKLAESAILAGEASPSPNLVFDAPTPFFGMEAKLALEQFFHDQVTVAVPMRHEGEPVESIRNEALQQEVYALIRQKGEPFVADSIIPHSAYTMINTERGPRAVRIPLQPEGAAGGLESAAYSPPTVKVHLLEALVDIECVAAARSLGRTGLFILRPDPADGSESRLRLIDNAIDHVTWRAPSDCRVEVESNASRLADHILDWATRKAA